MATVPGPAKPQNVVPKDLERYARGVQASGDYFFFVSLGQYANIVREVQKVVLSPLPHCGKHREAMHAAFATTASTSGNNTSVLPNATPLRAIGFHDYVILGRKMGLQYRGR